MNFEAMTKIRNETVDGIGPWVWPIEDTGAWDGPSQECCPIRDSLKNFSRKHDVIVQAGGCCGMYPRVLSRTFREVYTFEPAPLNWYCLQKNCAGIENIRAFNFAVGDSPGTVLMKINNYNNVGMNTIRQSVDAMTDDVIEVPQITIDSLNLAACDAIQLDVESYEGAVLLGAHETINKYRPVISIENKSDSDPATLFLKSLNYRVVERTRADTTYAPAEFA